MSKEFKNLRVATHSESYYRGLMADFGWELESSQEVVDNDINVEVVGDYLITTKTRDKYVKMNFVRDTSMPHYSELRDLENEYFSLEGRKGFKVNKKSKFFVFLGVVLCLVAFVGIVLAICGGSMLSDVEASGNTKETLLGCLITGCILGSVGLALAVLLFVCAKKRKIKVKKLNEKINAENEEKQKRQSEIAAQAYMIVKDIQK